MGQKLELTTVEQLRDYIGFAEEVRIQVRFGTCEEWVKLAKKEARVLIDALEDNATPEHMEMFTGTFGTFEDNILWMG